MGPIELPKIVQRIGADDSELQGLGGRFSKLGGMLGKAVAAGAAVAAAAVGAFVAKGVKDAVELDRGLREVNSLFGLTGEAAEASMADLTSGVRTLSDEIGVAQTTITDGLYQAISAGVPRENALEFLKVASEAAIAGVTDTETAVNGISTYLNAFGLEADQAQRVADSMFASVAGGKVTFEELSTAIAQVAPSANAAGVSIEEVNAGFATLANAGVAPAVAATQMRAALVGLQRPSADLDAIFADLGYESAQMAIESEGLGFALNAVAQAADGDNGKLTKLLGSVEAVGATQILAAEGGAEFAAQLERQEGSAGAATTAFEEMEKSSARQMERLKVTLQNLAIGVGQTLLPVLNRLAEWATRVIPPAFAAVKRVVDAVTGAFREGGLAGAMTMIGEKIREVGPVVLAALADLGERVLAWIARMAPVVGRALVSMAKAFSEWIIPLIPPMLQRLATVLAKIGQWILDKGLPLLVRKLREWGMAFLEWVAPLILPMLGELGKLLLKLAWWIVSEALPAILGKLQEWAVAFVLWVPGALVDLIAALARLSDRVNAWIMERVRGFVSSLGEWASTFVEWVGDAVAALPGKLGELASTVLTFVTGLPGQILDGLSDLASLLYDVGANMIRGLIDGVSSMASALMDNVTDTVMAPVNYVKDKLGIESPSRLFRGFGSAVGQGLALGIEGERGRVGQAAARLTDAVSGPGPLGFRGRGGAGPTVAGGTTYAPVFHVQAFDPAEAARELSREQAFAMALIPAGA